MNREHLHLMARVGTAIYQQDDLQQTDLDAVYDEVEKLVSEVEHLRGERAAVVAWLRANREASTLPKACWEADAIERGEHRKEKP